MSTLDDLIGTYVPGYGNIHAKLAIVGEAPGYNEAQAGIPFVGTTGKMLEESLMEAGLSISECYRTNVFKYYPGDTRFESDAILRINTGHTLAECLPQLWDELRTIGPTGNGPNAILAVGDLALQTLTGKEGIFTWRGSILETKTDPKIKVIPTVHPAALFKQKGGKSAIPWRFWYIIKQDIYRAVEDSEFPELRLPIRQHRICRGSNELEKFLDKVVAETPKINGYIPLSTDIESYHNIPALIGFAPNATEAMSTPLFNLGSWKQGHRLWQPGKGLSKNEYVRIWRIFANVFADKRFKFIGQNFKYDHEKIENTLGFYIGPGRLLADVGMMSHVIQPEFRIGLDFLTSIYTREPYYKEEGKEFDINRHPLEQWMTYNCKDCLVTFEIYEKLLVDLRALGLEDFYFNYKNELHDFYMAMERKGLKINETFRAEMFEKYIKMYNDHADEIKAATGYSIKPTPHDAAWLLFKKLGLPERENTADETLSLLYANHAQKNEPAKVAIRNILRMRRIRLALGKTIGAIPDFDGRMRSTWRIPGTETDRSATGVLDSPVRPELHIREGVTATRKGTLKKKRIGTSFHGMTKHGDIGAEVRGMYVPDEGEWFGTADLSQAEARIVALLANDKELVQLFDTVDIHSLTASWLFGIKIEKVDKKGPLRQTAKSVRHAGNYDMGKKKLVELLAIASLKYGMDLNMSEWRAGEILRKFHAFTPRIRSVFHASVVMCLKQDNRTLVNAFGRPRTFHERWGDGLFREAYADIPQSTVPEHLKMAGLRIKKRAPEIMFVNEAHDAFDWASKIEDFDRHARIVKEEMEKPIDFSKCSIPRGILVIPAEVKVAKENYRDFKDYKFEKVA